jgi:hypothetical protein
MFRCVVGCDRCSKALQERERGENTWDKIFEGPNGLAEQQFFIAIAGRTRWNEDDAYTRAGYVALLEGQLKFISPESRAFLFLQSWRAAQRHQSQCLRFRAR